MTTFIEATELQDAAELAQQCQLAYENLIQQRKQQVATVSRLSMQLRDLLTAKEWLSAETPTQAAEARLECTEVAEDLRIEEQMLGAIEAAIRNTEAEVMSASNRIQGVISQLIFAQFGRTALDNDQLVATG